jgi:hypothetical protein
MLKGVVGLYELPKLVSIYRNGSAFCPINLAKQAKNPIFAYRYKNEPI